MATATVRPYAGADERGWLECRPLSFFGSAFHDEVVRAKERYRFRRVYDDVLYERRFE